MGASEFSYREKVSLLAYSPLAFGVLSGKYLNSARPEKARLTLYTRFTRYFKENADAATAEYVKLAQEHGLTPAQMALAWVNQQGHVASNIIGATNLEQLKENIDSVDITFSDELKAEINAIHLVTRTQLLNI